MFSIMTIRTFFRNFFSPALASSQLHKELKEQRTRIQELKSGYQALSKWNHQYVSTLSLLTDAMEALIWKKDKHHRYILANPLHCKVFFGYDANYECLDTIVGRSDGELIAMNFTDLGIQNTFVDVCFGSDKYASENKEITHFLEAGLVDGKEMLLYAVKTPQFTSEGEFVGTIGLAWDMTSQSKFLIKQLNRWIYSGKAKKLYHKKDVFCYAITPELRRCQIFHHICPYPERGKECDGRCNLCNQGGNDDTMGQGIQT
ncbi:MAG: hypothetical protein GY797_01585 [Deltaproteobacteria bacterium]|nr:hypothetical protein [Deltaproteobacteria bacterium]